jgi:hypothetical protein
MLRTMLEGGLPCYLDTALPADQRLQLGTVERAHRLIANNLGRAVQYPAR